MGIQQNAPLGSSLPVGAQPSRVGNSHPGLATDHPGPTCKSWHCTRKGSQQQEMSHSCGQSTLSGPTTLPLRRPLQGIKERGQDTQSQTRVAGGQVGAGDKPAHREHTAAPLLHGLIEVTVQWGSKEVQWLPSSYTFGEKDGSPAAMASPNTFRVGQAAAHHPGLLQQPGRLPTGGGHQHLSGRPPRGPGRAHFHLTLQSRSSPGKSLRRQW